MPVSVPLFFRSMCLDEESMRIASAVVCLLSFPWRLGAAICFALMRHSGAHGAHTTPENAPVKRSFWRSSTAVAALRNSG